MNKNERGKFPECILGSNHNNYVSQSFVLHCNCLSTVSTKVSLRIHVTRITLKSRNWSWLYPERTLQKCKCKHSGKACCMLILVKVDRCLCPVLTEKYLICFCTSWSLKLKKDNFWVIRWLPHICTCTTLSQTLFCLFLCSDLCSSSVLPNISDLNLWLYRLLTFVLWEHMKMIRTETWIISPQKPVQRLRVVRDILVELLICV